MLYVVLTISMTVAQRAVTQQVPADPTDPLLNEGPKSEAVGDQVMVSTQLPAVTQAALKVLRDGGNAVDAFVTAVFMQHVQDYHQVSVFGAMSGLYYEASTGKYHAFNAFSERPLGDSCEHGDPAKVAIGGTVRGLESLAERFGTRPWASNLEPAIEAAERGVLVTSFMYRSNYRLWERSDWVKKNEQARRFYMPDGHLVPVGERWKMTMLAETLRKVASEGADYLYTGAWGQKFVERAKKKGGCVRTEDMAAYETRWMEPARFTYRGHEIVVEPPPNKGGLLVGQNLNVLENFDLKNLGHYAESADALEIMVRSFGKVESDMRWSIQDPLSYHNAYELWYSKEYAKMSADYVRNTMRHPHVDLSSAMKETAALTMPSSERAYDLGSNHNVIVDAEGNWITSLHTGHGGAPGVFIDGVRATGSRVRAETSGPGRRILAEVTGVFVLKDGKPWLSLGTPGFPPQPVTEVLVNILDFEMHPKEAADAPRFWAFLDERRLLRIESRLTEEVINGMAASGIEMEELGDYNWHTGSMQIIWRDAETGKLHGVTDPRRLGHAAGF
jgi:gamma-glutamyltranspeptidase/glutathione hydrolase